MHSFVTREKLILPVIFLFFLGGCATAPKKSPKATVTLKELCEQNNIQWHWDSVSQVVTLNYRDVIAKVLVGSNLVMMDKESISLSGSVKVHKGGILVPADFETKVIEQLIKEVSYVIKKFREIVVDAGHGGKDPGAIGKGGLREKEVVLDIAKGLTENLEKAGMKVIMTRTKDEFISLEDRTKIASASNADLFVSVHANSSRSRSAHGLEVFYLRELDYSKKQDEIFQKNFEERLTKFSMDKDSAALKDILMDMMTQYKKGESKHLAEHVSASAPERINAKNRGIKSSGFFVLRNTLIPAILVEVGFLTNADEEALLRDSAYRKKVAEGLTKSVLDYVE